MEKSLATKKACPLVIPTAERVQKLISAKAGYDARYQIGFSNKTDIESTFSCYVHIYKTKEVGIFGCPLFFKQKREFLVATLWLQVFNKTFSEEPLRMDVYGKEFEAELSNLALDLFEDLGCSIQVNLKRKAKIDVTPSFWKMLIGELHYK